ncbi:transposase [Staphylococcus pseudintermedius]|uniref:transposase n=1 Tax=Staphylococcus pseudintermedius TaxID=283734 RepID=UPI001D0237A6
MKNVGKTAFSFRHFPTFYNRHLHQRGPSSYHPKMMLKIILYSYANSVFSGRRIEHLLKDSCRMM